MLALPSPSGSEVRLGLFVAADCASSASPRPPNSSSETASEPAANPNNTFACFMSPPWIE